MKKGELRRWNKAEFRGRTYLMAKLEGLLRFEVRLKAAWLERRGLHLLGNWTPAIARKILREELRDAFSKGSVLVKPIPESYNLMSKKDHAILAVWQMGRDVKECRGRSSFWKDKKRFKDDYGIDLTSHPDGLKEMSYETAEILRNAKVWLAYPKSACEHGVIALRDNSPS